MRLKLYKGSWYVVWTEGSKTRRFALRTKDRAVAEQRFADHQRQPIGNTVAEIFPEYVNELAAKGRDAQRARDAWKALERVFGALRADQITRPLCRSYADERRQFDRSDGTIGKELSCLRAALRWHNKHTPADVELPRRPPPKDRRLSRKEYSRLRLAAKNGGLHLYVFVVLGIATAGRRQALLDLTWDRVDFKAGIIRLAGSGGGKGRATVPMTRHAQRVLRLAQRARQTVFVIEYAGRPVGSVKRGFASACARAGLEGVTPHVLRHTAAVWMAERGVPMSMIAQYLGHSDDRITQRVYARYSPDYMRQAAAALE